MDLLSIKNQAGRAQDPWPPKPKPSRSGPGPLTLDAVERVSCGGGGGTCNTHTHTHTHVYLKRGLPGTTPEIMTGFAHLASKRFFGVVNVLGKLQVW